QILDNYNDYLNSSAGNLCNCKTGTCTDAGSVADFTAKLSAPPGGACNSATFSWGSFFRKKTDSTCTTNCTVTVDDFVTTGTGTTRTIYQSIEPLNGLNAEFSISSFGDKLDAKLDIIPVPPKIALFEFPFIRSAHAESDGGGRKSLQMVIDLQKTISTPAGNPNCRMCKSIPGAVCCGDKAIYQAVLYLENGTGRIMQASTSQGTAIPDAERTGTLFEADPKYESVKIKESTNTRKNFLVSSFPQGYIIDAAKQGSTAYYLTADGRIINSSYTTLSTDPKIQSIAYDGTYWFYLRSDGVVFKGSDITNLSTGWADTGIYIPRGYKLAMGDAPDPVP
ncbi:MAG: hypothetical protein HY537_15265, partial [Deltaproteobacteria bacterium]|nr:hypothetical protein [Deltaproteobacteria bacterium]